MVRRFGLALVVAFLATCDGPEITHDSDLLHAHGHGRKKPKKRCVDLRGEERVADATISQSSPALNQGDAVTLVGGESRGLREHTLLRFDLTSIPHGAATEIKSAKLTLQRLGSEQPGVFEIHRVTAAWDEASVTWQSFGAAFDPAVEGILDERHHHRARAEVEGLVGDWVHGAPNHGILIGRTDPVPIPDEVETFHSSEAHHKRDRPRLEVCYRTLCAPGDPGCALCDDTCALDHAAAVCDDGVCRVDACHAGFADCNQNPIDGCEAELVADDEHCSACGADCGPDGSCTAGVCVFPACAPGIADCDRDLADGCESGPCGDLGYCVSDADCASGFCVDGFCAGGAGYVHEWSVTGDMTDERDYVTATLLPDGRVLVSGGVVAFAPITAAEIYDPETDAWTPIAPMHTPRVLHTATVVGNRVLVTGGLPALGGPPVDTMEVYYPHLDVWLVLPDVMSEARQLHTATLLPSGDVLIAGGSGNLHPGPGATNSADIVRGVDLSVRAATPMASQHSHHTATLLQDGRVLIAAGRDEAIPFPLCCTSDAAEIYDPLTDAWSSTGPMRSRRYFHAASLLGDGQVLVTGGSNSVGGGLHSAEIYDPVANAWSDTAPMPHERYRHTSTRLDNGKVLVVGGAFGGFSPQQTAEIFEPAAETWVATASMTGFRYEQEAILLRDGDVLVVGGGGFPPGAERFALAGPLGATCAEGLDCGSGLCADGVCCDVACAGGGHDCQACSVAAGAPSDGTCAPLSGTSCDDHATCTTGGTCSAGTCEPGPSGPCASPPDVCYAAGVCQPAAGICDYPFADGPTCAPAAPDLDAYLAAHPNVASAIRWQFRQTSDCCPKSANDVDLTDWPAWSAAEKEELRVAFRSAWHWYFTSPAPLAELREYIVDPPASITDPALVANDGYYPETIVPASEARKIYIAWVAHALLVELAPLVPWRLEDYDQTSLRLLLSSGSMMRALTTGGYLLQEWNNSNGGYDEPVVAPLPRYTYAFMGHEGILAATTLDTIGNVLEWSRANQTHMVGQLGYGVADATWQHRGMVPLSRVIEGTPNALVGGLFSHWTAGCHGTVGFLKSTLRSVNIPVQGIMLYCTDEPWGTHHQAYFPTEDAYLDHGDNPYSSIFPAIYPATALLVDRPTYVSWTGTDALVSGHLVSSCINVGRRVNELAGP